MAPDVLLGSLASLSLVLLVWQWLAGVRFPLHRRPAAPFFHPPVTLLKPLKGADAVTAECLRSFLAQEYPAPVQLIFGVADPGDPAADVVAGLMREFPDREAQLLVCGPLDGANGKAAKLARMESAARHEVLVVSDADVRVPADFLSRIVAPLADPRVGLVNCFYRLANPSTLAMGWEAVAVNADFWAQVLQSRSLAPPDFALGAALAFRREQLRRFGGFSSLKDVLADDYELGRRIKAQGVAITLSTMVVECWTEPLGWAEVWRHQLRWGRTIRVCRPLSYFFSILSNATLWPLLWAGVRPSPAAFGFLAAALMARVGIGLHLQRLIERDPAGAGRRSPPALPLPARAALVPLKDLLQLLIWILAYLGNGIEWRGEALRVGRDGLLAGRGKERTVTSRVLADK